MKTPVPIYKSPDESFVADTCQPLVEAAKRGEVRLEALVHGHYPGRKLPAGELPGLKTAGYWDAAAAQRWALPWHRNEGIEITFLESGRLGFAVDDRDYPLEAGALTVTRPWQKHRVGSPAVGAGKLHWMILDVGVRRPSQPWKWPQWIMLSAADRNELAGVLRQTDRPVWKASSEIRLCFHAIAGAVESDRAGSSTSTLTIRINELLLVLLDLMRKQKPRLNESFTTSTRTVALFLEDLRRHPEHLALAWTVEGMANSCGLGVTRFVDLVKQITNMTPLRYVNHARLEHAAALLRAEKASVTAVTRACGFSSSQYFATVFGRKFGCSPSGFRDSARQAPAAEPRRRPTFPVTV
jgi:AraC-like DNA-binding protein